eukprot:960651_1
MNSRLILPVIWTLSMTPHMLYAKSSPNFLIFYVDDLPITKSWSESQPDPNLNNHNVVYYDVPTPNIDQFRNEAIVFERVYAGGPMCSPSRYSLLTGRYAPRSQHAIAQTLAYGDGTAGTKVNAVRCKMSQYDDSTYNMPQMLHAKGYMTGHVGKWHLLTPDGNGESRNCAGQNYHDSVDETRYNMCKGIVQRQTGFDFVSAFYSENIESDSPYSHNPEWMIHEAQTFINQSLNDEKPFFLYLATTLCHTPDILQNEVLSRPNTETPKGTLSGDQIPNNTGMQTRQAINATIHAAGFGDNDAAACLIWVDDMFGALMKSLTTDVADNTFIVFANDHGMGAKRTLFEQGARQLHFIRYPPLFNITDGNPRVISDDLVVASYDLPPVIYKLADITIPSEYVMDGQNWIQDVLNNEPTSSKERYSDMTFGHMIGTHRYKYIFKANNLNQGHAEDYYPNSDDLEQFYGLISDPSEQTNLLNTAMATETETVVAEYRAKMIKYIKEIACPATNVDACITPPIPKCSDRNEIVFIQQWSITGSMSPAIKNMKRGQAEEAFINTKSEECFDLESFDNTEYAYAFTWDNAANQLEIEMIVCCPEYSSFYGKYDATYSIDNVQSVAIADHDFAIHWFKDDHIHDPDNTSTRPTSEYYVLGAIVFVGILVTFMRLRLKRKRGYEAIKIIPFEDEVESELSEQNQLMR